MPSTHTLEKKDAMMGCGDGAATGRDVEVSALVPAAQTVFCREEQRVGRWMIRLE
jgi:hypothetical protein